MVEERKINPETVKKDKEKKEWSVYVEDFNTATLPHEKYYNMAAYMAKMDAIRTGESYTSFDGVASYDPSKDLASHASSLRRPVVETETYLSQAQLAELRRVQNERIEMGKRKTLGLEVKRDLGVRMDGSSAWLFLSCAAQAARVDLAPCTRQSSTSAERRWNCKIVKAACGSRCHVPVDPSIRSAASKCIVLHVALVGSSPKRVQL